MTGSGRDETRPAGGEAAALDEELYGAPEIDEPITEEAESRLVFRPRRLAVYTAVVLVIVAVLYVGLPLADLTDVLEVIRDASPWWIALALVFILASFASYIGLFRGIIGGHSETTEVAPRLDWGASYQITLAGLAATRLFSAGGAGGIALTYWAVRRAGMPRREAACRMVAFLVLLYTVYMVALVVCGVGLRTGVFPGPAPFGMTVIPAVLAGILILIFLLVSLIPQDMERRLSEWARGRGRQAVWARRLATGPALVASGTRTAMALLRHPSKGLLAVGGAVGFWATNIAVLWACFHAFGGDVTMAVLIQGFFVGMTANLVPFVPGGVGTVDAGMIAAFLAFGEPGAIVIVSVLTYRVIAFWLPLPPGAVAYLQLRRRVSRWRAEEAGAH